MAGSLAGSANTQPKGQPYFLHVAAGRCRHLAHLQSAKNTSDSHSPGTPNTHKDFSSPVQVHNTVT